MDNSTASLSSSDFEESWKAEYEAQVQSWRSQSAEAREKAEKERLRWESIRAIEKEEATKRKAANIVDELPKSAVHPVGESSSNMSSADTTSSHTVPDSDHVSFYLRFSSVDSYIHVCQPSLVSHLVHGSDTCRCKPTFTTRCRNGGIGKMGGHPFNHVVFPLNVISRTCRHTTP